MKVIKVSDADFNNLVQFLNRVDLKGAEVPAFNAIARALQQATAEKAGDVVSSKDQKGEITAKEVKYVGGKKYGAKN